jgi:hypothetical protein
MLVREHVPEVRTLEGIAFDSQPLPPIRKLRSGQRRGGRQEEFLDPRLAIGKPVAEERKVGGKTRIGTDWMVVVWSSAL